MTFRSPLNVVLLGIFAALLISAPACSQNAPRSSSFPRQIEPGVSFYEATQPTAVHSKATLWIYLPTGVKGKIPCVVIGPAGTPLIWGMNLGDGDRAEHLPYVRAGFAVVAYSIDGAVTQRPTYDQAVTGYQAFSKAHAGVSDTFAAIDYIYTHMPQVDRSRVYAAGHSSAGTLALLASENDPRIRACVAYAPACDCAKREAELAKTLQEFVPDIADFLVRTSPITHAEKLHCPLFLFHADDDSNVPKSDNVAFLEKVRTTNSQVTFSETTTGNHYDSMIDVGVPRAIAWLKKLN